MPGRGDSPVGGRCCVQVQRAQTTERRDAAGPAEVFAEANRFGAAYRLKIASVDGCDVTTSIGTPFAVSDQIASIDSADTVLVAGGDDLVGRPIDPAIVDALKTLPPRTRRIASICTGSFILAQAGLLTGEPRVLAVSAAYLGLAVEAALDSPSLRHLVVFDYQPGVDDQPEVVVPG